MSKPGKASGLITAVKLYPAGATTNSHGGVRDIEKAMPVLERMAKIGLPLCVHGEVTTPEVDIFDREAVFIDTVLDPLRKRLPELKVTMEHVTTSDGIDYIKVGQGQSRRLDHHASPDHQPQRNPRRRHPPALLLPAGRQAREPSPGAACRGHQRRSALLPRHGFRTACRSAEGMRLRLRRHLYLDQHDELPCPCLRTGRRAGQARSLRIAERPGLVRPARQRGDSITLVKRPSLFCFRPGLKRGRAP
jgi:hypothetical protein